MSKSTKKRTKSYNTNKLVQRYDAKNLNSLMVTFVGGGSGKSHVVNRTTKFVYKAISKGVEKQFIENRHTWTVYCAILCRDNNRNNYVKADELHFCRPVLQTDIQEFLTDYHIKLLNQQNENHVIGIAWIACPYEIELDEEYAYNIFEMLGGFNKKAKWELVKDLV